MDKASDKGMFSGKCLLDIKMQVSTKQLSQELSGKLKTGVKH